jgi:hypothetical protein
MLQQATLHRERLKVKSKEMADVVYVVINENNANPSQHVSSGEERRKLPCEDPQMNLN